MITIDRSTPYTPTKPLESPAVERSSVVKNEGASQAPKSLLIDRRKNRDRRHKNPSRILLESRSGSDRRKNIKVRRPSIDIKA